jgi:UDP-N-acetylglucosamine 1-carboxyvinyltransferase
MLSLAPGISVVTEKIYPDRFHHLAELNRMGADIQKEANSAIVRGVPRLSGTDVEATDLRAAAALVLAGLVAEGKTRVHKIHHLDRGYERMEDKLTALGASIVRDGVVRPAAKAA